MKEKNKKQADWYIKIEQLPDSGGPFELVQKTCFYVIDRTTDYIAFTFEGSSEATFEGPGWGNSSYSGVTDVTISKNKKNIIVNYSDKRIEKYTLPTEIPPVKEKKTVVPEIIYIKMRCPACGSENIQTEIKTIGAEGFQITSCADCKHTIDVLDEWQMD